MTMPAMHDSDFSHVTVMRSEVVEYLAPCAAGTYLDATAGGGGHAAAILEANSDCRVIACDRDPAAVAAASRRLGGFGARASVEQCSFSELSAVLSRLGVSRVEGIVADLGVSSPQLDDSERGMSFRRDGPLDMRMDPSRGETAAELVNRLSQDALADVIFQLGEERRSRRVARCIKQAAEAGELRGTMDLRRAVVRAVGPRRVGGIDPATRTFQALRLAVNRELDELATLLESAARLLAVDGVVVCISFHSLEDRLVKRAFLDAARWERLTKKPRLPGEAELLDNPRSRSAKLRAARRLSAPPGLVSEGEEDFDVEG